MKKNFSWMLILCLLLCLLPSALAAGLPTATFVSAEGSTNGGCEYELKIRLSREAETDVNVTVRDGQNDEYYTVLVPAGQKQASCTVKTAYVDKRQKVYFTIEDGEGYQTNGSRHTVTLYGLPKVTFYEKVYLGALGREMAVKVKCSNTANILSKNNVFQLRGSDGTVLAERKWPSGSKEMSFRVTVTEEMLGRQDLSVWVGGQKVSTEDGYASLADTSVKIIQELDPQVPLMAIGIDCAYDDSKTDEILEVLDKHGVKVTFFMTGYFLREFPESAKKIAEAGHEIGNHSNTHEHMVEMGTYNKYRQLMRPVEDAEALLGVSPRLFRPPFGEFNSDITSICRSEGMEVIMWTMSYHDSLYKYTRERQIEFATTYYDYGPGSIALCHLDGVAMPITLDAGLTYYKEQLGLSVVPISALIYASGGELWPMPDAREPLLYTDEYWPNWLRENLPEYAWVLDQ